MNESEPQVSERKEQLNIRVLLADDEESMLLVSSSLLRGMGCIVDIVRNGQELLDKLTSEQYDLVVTDNSMPIMTGIKALKIIRADERFRDLPVIVNTGDEWSENEIKNSGGIYLSKPFANNEAFKETVRKAVEKSAT